MMYETALNTYVNYTFLWQSFLKLFWQLGIQQVPLKIKITQHKMNNHLFFNERKLTDRVLLSEDTNAQKDKTVMYGCFLQRN